MMSDAVAVRAVIPGGREEGDEVEPEGLGAGGGDDETGFGVALDAGGCSEEDGVLAPGGGESGDLGFCVQGGAVVAFDADGERGGWKGGGFGVEGGAIGGGGFDGDAPEAIVGDAGAFADFGGLEFEGTGQSGVEGLGLVEGDGGGGSGVLD